MKKYLKILTISSLLLFEMQIFGQGIESVDDSDCYTCMRLNNQEYCTCNQTIVTIMTYNIFKRQYANNGNIIFKTNPDVCAVQEIISEFNFNILKKNAKMEGKFLSTKYKQWTWRYGIGLLWKSSTVGDPINIVTGKVSNMDCDFDGSRGYIIAEFKDFIVVSTHYPTSGCENYRDNDAEKFKLTNKLLRESIIQNTDKPVFIAGDINFSPHSKNLMKPFADAGFEILNDTTRTYDSNKAPDYVATSKRSAPWYMHATKKSGSMIDFILGNQKSSTYRIIHRRIPLDADKTFKKSDHLPYEVRVAIKK